MLCSRERAHDHDRHRPLVEDAPRRLDAVEARHLHVEHGEVRLGRSRELDGLDAVARLRADVEAGRLEHASQVEADERLVLGDENPHRRTTRTSSEPSSPRAIRTGHE